MPESECLRSLETGQFAFIEVLSVGAIGDKHTAMSYFSLEAKSDGKLD